MITAVKARELMRQEGDDQITAEIEGLIIDAAKNSKTSVSVSLPNLTVAQRIGAAFENHGFRIQAGWVIKSDPTCTLSIFW